MRQKIVAAKGKRVWAKRLSETPDAQTRDLFKARRASKGLFATPLKDSLACAAGFEMLPCLRVFEMLPCLRVFDFSFSDSL
jgi:hypothetical protein